MPHIDCGCDRCTLEERLKRCGCNHCVNIMDDNDMFEKLLQGIIKSRMAAAAMALLESMVGGTEEPKSEYPTIQEKTDTKADPGEPTCCICTDNKPSVFFQPCGHVRTCCSCLIKHEESCKRDGRPFNCPMCATPIEDCHVASV
jgi:hypothetical protein